jgi:hypothetical protein
MKWYFPPQLPGQVETEVTQRDQFSNDEVEISETIVREAVQNSLDAAVDDPSRVKVNFRWLDSSHGLDPLFMEGLFGPQLEHATAAGLDVDKVDFSSPCALVIEDFGTKGLTGSVNSKDDDNFSDFWRRHGKSHKTGKSRGRWGLGKLVYSSSSELGVFFGATVRNGDLSPWIMGQTVLNLRTVDGHQYPPHAFFADLEGEGDIYREVPVPLKDQSLVEKFQTQFCLERGSNTGLSIIVPFPNPDFQIDAMLGVAIVNYFYPLVTGQLVLKFNDIEINSKNIRQLAHKYASESFHDIDMLFDFIEQANRMRGHELLTLRESWADDTRLDETDFEEEDLETIRKKFANGQLVGLKLPITLKEKSGVVKKTEFRVFIQRPEELVKGLDLYVRGGLTLPGEAKFRERKALGAMIAEDEAICSFLGDAENAAHTKWVSNAEKVRKNYRSPQARLQVIKNSVLDLYDLLAEVTEEVDELALSSFFWCSEPEGGKAGRKKKSPVVIPKPPEPRPKDFSISSVDGGFSVSTHKDVSPDRFPRIVTIDVAYDVASGNPFKKYSPLDFRLDKNEGIVVALTKGSGSVVERKENRLKFRVDKSPFKLHLRGFDPLRDVKVKLVSEA